MKKIFLVKEDYINTRLDRWFKKEVSKVPQSFIEKNIRKGNIRVNNKKNKSSYRIQKNDEITIQNLNFNKNKSIKETYKYIPNKNDLSLSSNIFIENNENFAVINKPPGIAVQAGTKTRKNIIDILRKTKEFSNSNPYVVHRIDKETTGVLIIAKNRKYAQLFTTLFRIRKIHKSYLCLAIGQLNKKEGSLINDLFYYEGKKKIKTNAITHFTLIDSNSNYSLIKLNPETGRKHQLRKQLLIYGHPVLGDSKYSLFSKRQSKKNNLMLHAHKIHFKINNIKYNFTADLPEYFKKFLRDKYLKII
tara:strand:+ start:280 stop:1191 length:912 start_codon:yes stop_codon:yes gene_type:complete